MLAAMSLAQSTPVGTTIFRHIQALDKDAGVNGLVEYFIVEGNTNTTEDEKMTIADGYGTFAISFPHQGQVTVAKTLDYEKVQRYYLTIVATFLAEDLETKEFSMAQNEILFICDLTTRSGPSRIPTKISYYF
ncbi:unnamed protein product [Ceratitis capitata]|uniref:(Mediterranean fruit fly) hypothetical protein n=1 Tax=Ceratitis capitata TaxID=7213 RepID=A0A811U4F9_CERCA|nr:unnamed protein product [Ceratitis capitata]